MIPAMSGFDSLVRCPNFGDILLFMKPVYVCSLIISALGAGMFFRHFPVTPKTKPPIYLQCEDVQECMTALKKAIKELKKNNRY